MPYHVEQVIDGRRVEPPGRDTIDVLKVMTESADQNCPTAPDGKIDQVEPDGCNIVLHDPPPSPTESRSRPAIAFVRELASGTRRGRPARESRSARHGARRIPDGRLAG
jgi:hypothetical protein